MYNDNAPPPQYPNSGYHNNYPQYPQEYSSNYGYQGYVGYSDQNPQPPNPGQANFPTNDWANYNSSSKDAVVQEMQQQKAQLIRQREDYVRKASVLRHELDQLHLQKHDLVGNGRSPDRDLDNILEQNGRLQEEVQGKLKAIHNVIEMLSSIIKDGKSLVDLEAELVEPETPTVKSPTPTIISENRYKSHSPDAPKQSSSENFCYVHYDTGLHWCRMCDEFPETAKDFLLHLQDQNHREKTKDNDADSTPWHKLPAETLMPSDEKAPMKRVPIKGLQFFISAPSWYCKLCDVWIGDLHCASQHLKSRTHYHNYENFVNQNPHWEMEWIKDRETSMTRKSVQDSSDSDKDKKKRKRKEKQSSTDPFSLKDKKKKKRSKRKKKQSSESSSSSSSSDSSSDENEDPSRSIRVAMRNTQKVQSIMDEDLSAKWNVLEKLVEEHKKKEFRDKQEKEKREVTPPEDPLINQWMTVSQPPEKERMMFDSLKDRMRQKHEQERERLAELRKIQRQKEQEEKQEELERLHKKVREEREEAVRLIIKEKQQEILEKQKEKERQQIRFKPTHYSKIRRSPSRSDEEEDYLTYNYKADRRDSEREGSYKNRNSRSRSRSHDQDRQEENAAKKKPPGPTSYKKLPFIGRMPLFKNKNKGNNQEAEEPKELRKHSYATPRRTRFEPGNLPRAFIPKPDVVCFPKLSSIPPLTIPPPPLTLPPPAPTVTERLSISQQKFHIYSIPKEETPPSPTLMETVTVPEAPKIRTPKAPPPPKIEKKRKKEKKADNLSDDEILYGSEGANPSMMGQYYQGYGNNVYQEAYTYQNQQIQPSPPHSYSMPLQPPPLPPDDDLAMLGICADDMAAQSF